MLRSSLFISTLSALLLAGCNGQPEAESSVDQLPEMPERNFQLEGKVIAESSFKALSGELAKAMQEGGIERAVQYCNLNALSITDSLSHHFDVEIRRATDRPRNGKNLADDQELMIMDIWSDKIDLGEELKATVFEDEAEANFYAPIRIQPQCLNCHGVPDETMPQTNADLIANIYPDDQATGYALNELRGMWHIRFKK